MPDMLYDKFENYAIFTMNRPERLNANGGRMNEDFAEALKDFTADPAMRCGILTGTGRAFSAGRDLKEMAQENTQLAPGSRRGPAFSPDNLRLSRNPKPWIAAINGICVAGGLERALDCDIRICSTEAYLGLWEVKRGIMPGYGVYHLPRLVPFGDAMYIMLTADKIMPDDALRMGLVREVLPPERLIPRAVEIAQMIAANAPLAVEGTKAVAQQWRQLQIDDSYRFGEWVGRVVLNTEDAKEGPIAFTEKRPAVWKGR